MRRWRHGGIYIHSVISSFSSSLSFLLSAVASSVAFSRHRISSSFDSVCLRATSTRGLGNFALVILVFSLVGVIYHRAAYMMWLN